MTSLLPTTFAAQKSLPQATINQLYRPFIIQNPIPIIKENGNSNGVVVESEIVDWVDELELDYVQEMVKTLPEKMNVLILYGSLRERFVSFITKLILRES